MVLGIGSFVGFLCRVPAFGPDVSLLFVGNAPFPSLLAMSLGVLMAGCLVLGISLGLFELAGNIGNSWFFGLLLLLFLGIWCFCGVNTGKGCLINVRIHW